MPGKIEPEPEEDEDEGSDHVEVLRPDLLYVLRDFMWCSERRQMITSMAGADPLPLSATDIERCFRRHRGSLGPLGTDDFERYEALLERLDRMWRTDFREKAAAAREKAEKEAKSKRRNTAQV